MSVLTKATKGIMNRKDRYKTVLGYFREKTPRVTTELEFGSVFQLLAAVMLSAQCTDKRVNMVTPALFARYPDAKAMAAAEPEDVYEYVRSVSYPNSKARHLVEMARILVSDYGGNVPETLDGLLKLPGVGRKTANVIQAVAYGRSVIAVDTHVFRVSRRLGLVSKSSDTPLKVEKELTDNIPSELVADAHHWLLLHGRYVCTSRAPHCDKCPFDSFCPKLMDGSKLS